MDTQTTLSKYVIWILIAVGVIALLIGLLVRGTNGEGETENFDAELARCEEDLADLNERLTTTATRTPELEAQLEALIERCSEVVEDARDAQ